MICYFTMRARSNVPRACAAVYELGLRYAWLLTRRLPRLTARGGATMSRAVQRQRRLARGACPHRGRAQLDFQDLLVDARQLKAGLKRLKAAQQKRKREGPQPKKKRGRAKGGRGRGRKKR